MTREHWFAVVDQAAAAGVELVQLIGGEPTLHPDALDIAHRALDAGLQVEVYSNLVKVADSWWKLLAHPRASVATSYYSGNPDRHNAMTGCPASHRRTRANITTAVFLGVDIRVSIVTSDGEGVEETRADLEALDAATTLVPPAVDAAIGQAQDHKRPWVLAHEDVSRALPRMEP